MAQSLSQISRIISTLLLFAVLLTACSPAATSQPTPDLNAAMTQVVATVYAGATQTSQAAPAPMATPMPQPTAVRTPPALPAEFSTSLLNPLDTPHTYTDTCQYLKAKWDPNNAVPGTVVMVIMFHSILKAGNEPTDYNQISAGAFEILMRDLHEQNFQAINTQQLADFLEHNATIPSRSILLLVDDRHYAEYFDTYFRPYWESYGWPVVNAWISTPLSSADLWQQQVDLEAEGWVDHQAHGVVHNTPISEYSSDSYILDELRGSITAFQEHFNKTPIAFIWPGGGFTPRAAQLARQSGYRLGFTINPRGPLMFNWIPLSDNPDPRRPSYLPEGAVNDPLMVLPRFWSYDAGKHIDEVRVIGQEAADYAEVNRAVELEYYDIICAPAYGPISTPKP
ncbi:MAG: polysaccharide deacetylase family protein [Anaerolineales bacterium]|nr:polysaccharide deacetylase family protein [Anaerolineales bacterium]